MKKPSILIVDDEPDIRELLRVTLGRMDMGVQDAANLKEAQEKLCSQHFDLCLTDMRLPDGDGIELVSHMQQHFPDIPVAVITAFGNMEGAINTLKAGAFDYVSKPVDLNILRHLVNTALKLPKSNHKDIARHQLLGNAPVMIKLRQTITRLARSQAPVHITGPSGTGKELVAMLIHQQGPRADKPFVPVNCGAIPSELMESEFFGHKKGSFTGAVADKKGLFQLAHEGTLFLDEVGDLPLLMQVKLLRAIQEKSIRPLGSEKEIPVDVRMLSATHRSLEDLVEQREFRQDLFYRINVIALAVPSLQERAEDIPLLAEKALERFCEDEGVMPSISREAMDKLQSYAFPGNVRELENILERALTFCEGNCIDVEDLALPAQGSFVDKPINNGLQEETPLPDYLDNLEKQAILQALDASRWNKTAAAKRLGITFRALRYRLKKLGLE